MMWAGESGTDCATAFVELLAGQCGRGYKIN